LGAAAQRGVNLPDPFRLDMLIRSTLIALTEVLVLHAIADGWI
jgi:hypothetical protein